MAAHPDVDMVSFTGSTSTGTQIAKLAADTVQRVHQELGGKSANIILDDADLDMAIKVGVRSCFANSGQICTAPSRMLVPLHLLGDAERIAKKAAEELKVGPPDAKDTRVGPVVSKRRFDMVQSFIQAGINEGAELIAGGPGRQQGFDAGFYAKPTVFSKVKPGMTIAKSEIFGPVLSILAYRTEQEAIDIANDSVFGLAGYVQSKSVERALSVAGKLRAGAISINYPQRNMSAPLGGYKQSGNGRQFGIHGLMEFFEIKSITCDALPADVAAGECGHLI